MKHIPTLLCGYLAVTKLEESNVFWVTGIRTILTTGGGVVLIIERKAAICSHQISRYRMLFEFL